MAVFIVLIGCENNTDGSEHHVANDTIATTTELNIIPTFQFYGELLPEDLEVSDSLTLPYGFKVEQVAGCDVTNALVKEVKVHNIHAVAMMKERHGNDWRQQFETATGKSLQYFIIVD